MGDGYVFYPFFSCPHELASTWTHGRSDGLPTSLVVAKCTHWGGAYE
jgi:hypothetical protein